MITKDLNFRFCQSCLFVLFCFSRNEYEHFTRFPLPGTSAEIMFQHCERKKTWAFRFVSFIVVKGLHCKLLELFLLFRPTYTRLFVDLRVVKAAL